VIEYISHIDIDVSKHALHLYRICERISITTTPRTCILDVLGSSQNVPMIVLTEISVFPLVTVRTDAGAVSAG
jgi:hypothetical protein